MLYRSWYIRCTFDRMRTRYNNSYRPSVLSPSEELTITNKNAETVRSVLIVVMRGVYLKAVATAASILTISAKDRLSANPVLEI
jgi:hypothetical protein